MIGTMRILFVVGLIVLVLGILSFFVPVPHTEHHGMDAGDFHVGVTADNEGIVAKRKFDPYLLDGSATRLKIRNRDYSRQRAHHGGAAI